MLDSEAVTKNHYPILAKAALRGMENTIEPLPAG
jgi:hypothetical protein